jgi:hypothetical protein
MKNIPFWYGVNINNSELFSHALLKSRGDLKVSKSIVLLKLAVQ